jgi:hypothetical protein
MEQTQHSRPMLALLAVVLLVASIIGFFVSQNINKRPSTAEMTQVKMSPTLAPTLIPYETKGGFSFKLRDPQASLKSGTPFIVDLYVTSSKDTVAGYDVVFTYDMKAFERQSIQNSLQSFRIFTFNRGNHVSISATKNIEVVEPIQFNNISILSFTFLPKQAGSFIFSLKPQGNESSKLVNESAVVTYPETTDLRLEIK